MTQHTAGSLSTPTPLLGIASACAVVCIWSGWVVSSRWGITTDFSPIDLTWLRFFSATLILLPLSINHPWRQVNWKKALPIALGCGFPYVWLAYIALELVPSANASVLINGFLPVMTSLLAFFFLRAKISPSVSVLFVAILLATGLMTYQPSVLSWEYIVGIVLLITASGILASYMLAVKTWEIALRDIVVWVPLINAVILFPFWLIYSEGVSAILALPTKNLLFHIVYQGLVVSVLAMLLFAFAIQKLGVFATSLYMAMVPVITALMAMILGEYPTSLQWAGIAICSLSLLAYSLYNQFGKKPTA